MNGVELGRLLLVIGLIVALLGAVLTFGGGRLRLGRLPGDIYIRRDGFVFYFPLATCLVASLVLSAILMLVFRR